MDHILLSVQVQLNVQYGVLHVEGKPWIINRMNQIYMGPDQNQRANSLKWSMKQWDWSYSYSQLPFIQITASPN